MTRLLIVDDDIHLRRLVRTYAEREGYGCDEAETGLEALDRADRENYDLMVLDVLMPGMNGFETLRELRGRSEMPVIMLTARNEEYDKLEGFRLGADDYLSKPFSPGELIARIKAVLKRTAGQTVDLCRFGELSVSRDTREAKLSDRILNLSPKEFDLLYYMMQNENIVLSREKLLNHVWGYDFYGDARTIDTHVKSLREHLGDYRIYIKTVWGIGYKFEYR